VEVSAEQVAGMIDEIPVLAAVAAWAEGVTEIRGLTELRVKESDRLSAISANLAALGVESEAGPDWIRIKGGGVQPGRVQAFDDHRIAMAFAVAGLPVGVQVTGAEWAGISFPGFFPTLEGLR
jgi:3-phosphoshikimate 1-carboxyvinyltransferase